MKQNQLLQTISFILLLIGGLNWGFVGLFQMDVIGAIFGEMSMLSRVIYTLVGLSALYRLFIWIRAVAK